MENVFSKPGELMGTLKEYADTGMESLKLNAAEKSSDVIANVWSKYLKKLIHLGSYIIGQKVCG